jgi:hypothetical protein
MPIDTATPARALEAPTAAAAITARAKNIFFIIAFLQSPMGSIPPTLQFDFYSMHSYL